ncbi:MAG: hypothetical protein KKB81_08025 [Candidatus Margulisbacteria bacterium]|nr:hypothetical protein [Candidatus Margulisiibacteriota bacterium]MBU1021758.1 hypothetical protein [Candidatus Margulisiibacteriota bacterium]MBU1729504.1 hypothetical protein [Candidatus Margulisiibacteriota bacterium]MBU1955395.1 hypothetical protein [Candidatus Margulisiibacteriota bacterium]
MEPQKKLEKDIGKFLEVYKVLNTEARAAFEAQMESTLKNVDEKTRKLYIALLDTAKDNGDLEEAIDNLNRTANGRPYK